MKLTMLWSDYCVLVLFVLIVSLIILLFRRPAIRSQWFRICLRPLNLAAMLVLTVYLIIGFIDSIHFEKPASDGGGIVSLLDRVLYPMSDRHELTYSAPFAIYSFSQETRLNPDGTVSRDHPRLIYAGQHLSDPALKEKDIRQKLITVIFSALVISLAGFFMVVACLSSICKVSAEQIVKHVFLGKMRFPWRTLLSTLFAFLFIFIFVSVFMDDYHILGTDQVGEDVFYQALKSIRTGLIIGTFTTLITLPFALALGLSAGYFSGIVDDLIQFIYTLLSSIPAVLLIAAVVLTLQITMENHTDWFETINARSDARLLALCAILGLTSWTSLCRYLRGEALKIRQLDYVQAARSLGVSNFSILLKHLLPNVMHIVLITIILDFSGLVLAEAVLTYVGVGVDPNTYSWGMMINSARMELARVPVVWWTLFAAFIFMLFLVLAANLFSDALRDMMNPHHNNGK